MSHVHLHDFPHYEAPRLSPRTATCRVLCVACLLVLVGNGLVVFSWSVPARVGVLNNRPSHTSRRILFHRLAALARADVAHSSTTTPTNQRNFSRFGTSNIPTDMVRRVLPRWFDSDGRLTTKALPDVAVAVAHIVLDHHTVNV